MRKGGIRKTLLLSIAMFICGYLAAVCMLSGESLNTQEQTPRDYNSKLAGITSQIREAVAEHGAAAYSEIAKFLTSLDKDEKKPDNTEE
jgi:hypothetical protein